MRSVDRWELFEVGHSCAVIISTYTPRWLTKVDQHGLFSHRGLSGFWIIDRTSKGLVVEYLRFLSYLRRIMGFLLCGVRVTYYLPLSYFFWCLVYQQFFPTAVVFIARILAWLANRILSLLSGSAIWGSGIGRAVMVSKNLGRFPVNQSASGHCFVRGGSLVTV